MSERPLHEHIKELSLVLVEISDKVVDNYFHGLHAVNHQNDQGARKIKPIDYEIEKEEVELEERCLAFLAMQHPVAIDLRTIVTILMINDDLERISELSLHIINLMLDMSPEMLESYEFEKMGVHAGEMVKKSIKAFALKDSALADQVCAHDEEIDAMHRTIFNKATLLMKSHDAEVSPLIAALGISRYIKQIAAHASRIAQEVIYLVTGEIIHKELSD